jgi:uncharacterized membrane protein YGL010W
MQGMKRIVEHYQLTTHESENQGVFQWKRRMGVHLAFHRDPTNIAIHAVFSVLNAWAILLLAYPFGLFELSILGAPLNLALVTLLVMFVIYACMDIGAALFTVILFALTYPLCAPVFELLNHSTVAMVLLSVFLTVLALAVQVFIGHGISEQGIDDATDNFAEMFETKNPLYITLLPFYTYLDLMLMVGYKPTLARYINDITVELRPQLEAELTS